MDEYAETKTVQYGDWRLDLSLHGVHELQRRDKFGVWDHVLWLERLRFADLARLFAEPAGLRIAGEGEVAVSRAALRYELEEAWFSGWSCPHARPPQDDREPVIRAAMQRLTAGQGEGENDG